MKKFYFIKITFFLIQILFCHNNYSFGIDSGYLTIVKNQENSILNLKILTFIKLHYISLENNLLNSFTVNVKIIKGSLNTIETLHQLENNWKKEAIDNFKNILSEKIKKIILSLKKTDFSEKKNYFKNQIKLNFQNKELIYNKNLEDLLFKNIFPNSFSDALDNLSIKIVRKIKEFNIIFEHGQLIDYVPITKCRNGFECQHAENYEISKKKIINFVFENFNKYFDKEIKGNGEYIYKLPMELLKKNNSEYLGFYFTNEKNQKVFYIIYEENKNLWVIDELESYLRKSNRIKDDL